MRCILWNLKLKIHQIFLVEQEYNLHMGASRRNKVIKDITISEPWDFCSSDGKNILKVRIIKKSKNSMLVVALSKYDGMTENILIEKRDIDEHVNIYYLLDVNMEQKQLAMIGKM